MTVRSWRYCGSGAVMMSELVVGSAWICPPVEGWLLLVLEDDAPAPRPLPAAALELPLVVPLPMALRPPVDVLLAGATLLPALACALPVPADRAARSVAASLVASAFFRYTTWMLPLAALLPGAGGWSSFSTRARTCTRRAGLAARRMRALLCGSASSVVLKEVSACPGAAAAAVGVAPASIRRATSGARSVAMACLSGMISTSLALETSMAAMILPRRCRLSA